MTTKPPTAIRRARDRRPSPPAPDATDPARGERDHEQAAALWLYAWSYDALRPTGELLAARLTNPGRPSTRRQNRPHLAPRAVLRPSERSPLMNMIP